MVFAMARDKILPKILGATHTRTGSPYVAILLWSLAWIIILVITFLSSNNQTVAFGDFGSLSGYCFTLAYLLVAVAAPIYLYQKHQLSVWVTLGAAIGAVVMCLEFWYSFNPVPAAPTVYFVWIFVAAIGVILAGTAIAYWRAPNWIKRVGSTSLSNDSKQESSENHNKGSHLSPKG